ncbi:MAG: nickel-type superoxide dismutase maturation protease [Kamptonema sp. SIO4C4]|nr:nickel-type superoxide dismutase maturation protease [Kamptonema sp. SIO4C4]
MLAETSWREFLLWVFRQRRRFRVTGESMLPLLQPGEEVLVDFRAYKTTSPRVGDLVIARHPRQPELQLIKRVQGVQENGDCFLVGDNLVASTDSRQFGGVAPDLILGRVTCRFV